MLRFHMMHFHNYDDVYKSDTELIQIAHKHQKTLPQESEQKKLNRLTLCISSQVGCPVGCIFCVTGKL